jgi:hypothetical protein
MGTIIMNNSGILNLVLSPMSLLGKYIETKNGLKGVVVREWLCYPEPSEWVLDSGLSFTEEQFVLSNDVFIVIENNKKEQI